MPWYYLTDSRQVVGPISEKALKELNAVGVLAGETQVCREGTDVWTSLNGIFGASSPEATKEADPDEVSGEDPKEFYDQGDSIAHSDESQEGAQKHSFSDRLKREAKAGWSDIKRTSREASVHAHIEKLKHVDLRMALFALGKKCYESGMLEGELKGQFQVIRELDTTIAGKRETSEAEAAETKMAALKRMGKDAAKASHAQALTVKRQHLVTELGRQAYAKMMEECRPGLEAEIAAIVEIEGKIRSKEEEARTIGTGHAKGWKRITPRIAVAAGVAVLLIGGALFGLRMMGVGKDESFEKIHSEEDLNGYYESIGFSESEAEEILNYFPKKKLEPAEAMAHVAAFYEFRDMFDPEKIMYWNHRAAEEGSGEAMYRLGVILHPNFALADRGYPKGNAQKSHDWIRKAAEHGSSEGLNAMGSDLWFGVRDKVGGIIVEPNKREAVKWWKKAAKAGSTEAKNSLIEHEDEIAAID